MLKRKLTTQSSVFYPILASLAALTLSLLAGHFTSRNIRLHDEARFETFSMQVEQEIAYRMKSYIQVLVQTRNMFLVGGDLVDRKGFKTYVRNLDLNDQYGGMQGIGYTLRLKPQEVKPLERKLRGEGFPNFRVWPLFPREEYYSILYLEPVNKKNLLAFGYDMFSEEKRRMAMIEARDKGEPASTGVVRLVQDGIHTNQQGFLIYVPLFKGGSEIETQEERREKILGFIYSAFRFRDLFSSIFSHLNEKNPVGIRIYINDENEPIYQLPAKEKIPKNVDFIRNFKLDVAGKTWLIETYSLPHFRNPSADGIPMSLFLMGCLVSILIFLTLWRQGKHSRDERERAVQYARLYREANEAVKARDEFLSIASHELKTPVTALKLQFQMAQRRIELNDEKVYSMPVVKKRIANAISQLDRMNKLVDDMLETTRFSSGKIHFERKIIDVKVMLEEIVERFQEEFDFKGIPLSFSSEDQIEVVGDIFRLEQVISNLLTNAMKYGKGTPVEVSLYKRGDKALISIKDQGIGISKEAQERIFHRFERAISSNEVSGLGLGLFISRKIIEAHQGRIRVESEPNHGSTFVVEIPLSTDQGPKTDLSRKFDTVIFTFPKGQ